VLLFGQELYTVVVIGTVVFAVYYSLIAGTIRVNRNCVNVHLLTHLSACVHKLFWDWLQVLSTGHDREKLRMQNLVITVAATSIYKHLEYVDLVVHYMV